MTRIASQTLAEPLKRLMSPVQELVEPVQKLASPAHKPVSPAQKPASPEHKPLSPVQELVEPEHKPSSPAQKSASPAQKSASPAHKSASPAQKSASPAQKPASPEHKPVSPTHKPASPAHKSSSPAHKSASLTQKLASPVQKPASPAQELIAPLPRMEELVEKSSLHVADLNATSVDSFIFRSGNLALKMAFISERPRVLSEIIINKKKFPKCVISRQQFDREMEFQQQVYATLLPFTQVCPQVYQSTVYHPSSCEDFLSSLTPTTDMAEKMLAYVHAHLKSDVSIGVIVMELLPEPYIQVSQYIKLSPANFLNIALQVGARMAIVLIYAGVWNPDTHLGNVMVRRGDRIGNSVMLIDYGRGQKEGDYVSRHLRQFGKNAYTELEHLTWKEEKRFSEMYPPITVTTIDAESVFLALQRGLVIEYEVGWGEFQCLGFLRQWFPYVKNAGLFIRYKPTVKLFSREWFKRDHPECTRRLEAMAEIIRGLLPKTPLDETVLLQQQKDLQRLKEIAHLPPPPLNEIPVEPEVPAQLPHAESTIRRGGSTLSWNPRRWYGIPPTTDVDYNTTNPFITKTPVAGAMYKKTRKKKWTKRKSRK